MLARLKVPKGLDSVFFAGELSAVGKHDVVLVLDSDVGEYNPYLGIEIVRAVNKHGKKLVLVNRDFNKFNRIATVVIEKTTADALDGLAAALSGKGSGALQEAAGVLKAAKSVAVIVPGTLSDKEYARVKELSGMLQGVTHYPVVRRSNFQGSLDMGTHPGLYPGYQQVGTETNLQVWLQDIKVVADVFDPALFESDAVYARHIGQLNVFTFLIEHGDSNVGNFLISKASEGARVFSIDNGVAFASHESDRGKLWQKLRVKRSPADTVERLRGITEEALQARLWVLAQWQLQGEHYAPAPLGVNLAPNRGVRQKDGVVQLGLTKSENLAVWRQRVRLLQEVDAGRVATF